MLAIARQLKSKGHEVKFFASGYFEEKARAAGVDFIAIGDRAMYENALKAKNVWHPYFAFDAMWKILYETIPLTFDLLKSHYTSDTILVGSSLAFAARLLQEKVGAKLATVHLSPSIAISSHTPPVGPNGPLPQGTPLALKQLYVNMLDLLLLDRACRSDLNVFRKKIGLSPVKSVFTKWINSPDLVIMAWPEWFAPPQLDWPKNSVCTEFPIYEHGNTAEISLSTLEFINSGAPPVVFTAGSAMAQGAKHFKCATETLRNQLLRGIFVCKFKDMMPPTLPPNIHHTPYEPFDKLFEHASAIQHHGGIGTSIQALRAGKPQLVTPFAHDQFDNALRLEQLHVSKTSRSNRPDEWRRKLVELIGNSKVQFECDKNKKRIMSQTAPIDVIANTIIDRL